MTEVPPALYKISVALGLIVAILLGTESKDTLFQEHQLQKIPLEPSVFCW